MPYTSSCQHPAVARGEDLVAGRDAEAVKELFLQAHASWRHIFRVHLPSNLGFRVLGLRV